MAALTVTRAGGREPKFCSGDVFFLGALGHLFKIRKNPYAHERGFLFSPFPLVCVVVKSGAQPPCCPPGGGGRVGGGGPGGSVHSPPGA